MSFAGIDYWAIFIAAIAGNFAGAIWYWAFAKSWMAANDLTPEMIKPAGKTQSIAPYVIAFIAQLVMAATLAGVIGHLGKGHVTLRNGIVSGAMIWAGFVATTMLVNHTFSMRKRQSLLIDGGYWLLVLVLMGGIIGGLGVK